MSGERDMIGYRGISQEKGICVDAADAFSYAKERIRSNTALEEEYKRAVTDWFFSGDFVAVYEDEEETEEWRR